MLNLSAETLRDTINFLSYRLKEWNPDEAMRLELLARGFEEKHHNDVRSVAFSSDGRLLATGSGDDTAKVWEMPSGKLIATLLEEIEAAILGGIIIQEYPSHQPLPRCVIRSTATTQRPIEVVCDVSYEEEWVTIVTVMRGKTRRSRRKR